MRFLRQLPLLLSIFLPLFMYAGRLHVPHSVLATGTWYKIAVTHTGIHKITYNDLVNMGLTPSSLDPQNIRIFGNGGGMLPESNADARIDDLYENSIFIAGSDDGKFDPQDYILFYGEAADAWVYDSVYKVFNHVKNLYSDTTYYYINTDLAAGKRVVPVASLDSTPNSYSRHFADYAFHELDSVNLAKTGKLWLGEMFTDTRRTLDLSFSFPNIDTAGVALISIDVVNKAPQISPFYVWEKNHGVVDSIWMDSSDPGNINLYGREKLSKFYLMKPNDPVDLTISYKPPTSYSTGWLNYIELNCQRGLTWAGPQMEFRDPNSIGSNKITEFIMKGVKPEVMVWDITRKDAIGQVIPLSQDSVMKFRFKTNILRKFIAFDGSFFYPVKLVGAVKNQDLHSLDAPNMVIVTYPLFLDQAQRLADFHKQHDGLSYVVVTTEQIYNEFSSGQPDLSSIRDFVKMLYDKGTPGVSPRYLALFGDGSFDPKNRIPGNTNYIPTFQSPSSLNTLTSYVTDDFFGIMGDASGSQSNGRIDVGVGRFPLTIEDDARIAVDKIERYYLKNDTILSDWRNKVILVADSKDSNLHLHDAEKVWSIINTRYPFLNVNKIYLDTYPIISTPAGNRSPEVNKAINKSIDDGALILNYNGHGGEEGWAEEKVLTIPDIQSWTNKSTLPLFITATCEFSRFDNPQRFTGGEMAFLKEDGGAIALFSTTRAAFASANITLDTSIFRNLVSAGGKVIPSLGELLRIAKNNNGNDPTRRNFVLLGDPALVLTIPQLRVATSSISQDTAMGLSTVSIKGNVNDLDGNKITSFAGDLQVKVFDKPVINYTLGQIPKGYPEAFLLQNKLLFNGISTIKDGEFSFSFVVPKGISLNFGKGKISYYARTQDTDATGSDTQIIFGGEDPNINPVNPGPDITLYMDDPSFISGGKTGKSPVLYAELYDTNGINYYDLGIGHEIIGTLDEDNAHPIQLNDYFQPSPDCYGKGLVRYPFSGLSNGFHALRLKAWDLYDNSSQKEISFFVSESSEIAIKPVFAYPNPFRDMTTFTMTPVPFSGDLDIHILIYNFNGRLVRTLESKVKGMYKNSIEIPWDGTDENSGKLASGLYLYRFIVQAENGALSETSQKLIILR